MKQGFNLLKPQIEAPSVWTVVYKWVVGTARIVLIITETAVIAALVIRIAIDVQGKDLDEKITNYEGILNVRKEEEKKYLGLQSKTVNYRDSFDNNLVYSSGVNVLLNNTPLSFSKIDISITGSKISYSGEGPNADIKKLEGYIKSSSLFANSRLTSLGIGEDKDPNLSSTFNFETEFKGLPNRQLITDNEYIYN